EAAIVRQPGGRSLPRTHAQQWLISQLFLEALDRFLAILSPLLQGGDFIVELSLPEIDVSGLLRGKLTSPHARFGRPSCTCRLPILEGPHQCLSVVEAPLPFGSSPCWESRAPSFWACLVPFWPNRTRTSRCC